ncbi:MAG: ATP-binding protein [Phycisphaerales bacterium]|nr:MAG: ATP-binding protein [Phycisphaerales bacterium]
MTDSDRPENPPETTMVIQNKLAAAREPEQAILEQARRHGYSNDACFAIRLALEEALTNAIKHGNGGDPSKRVTIRYSIGPEEAVICVADEGTGFEPCKVPDCTTPERISLPDGRGIMLMRAYLDEVTFSERGNEVRLLKRNR